MKILVALLLVSVLLISGCVSSAPEASTSDQTPQQQVPEQPETTPTEPIQTGPTVQEVEISAIADNPGFYLGEILEVTGTLHDIGSEVFRPEVILEKKLSDNLGNDLYLVSPISVSEGILQLGQKYTVTGTLKVYSFIICDCQTATASPGETPEYWTDITLNMYYKPQVSECELPQEELTSGLIKHYRCEPGTEAGEDIYYLQPSEPLVKV